MLRFRSFRAILAVGMLAAAAFVFQVKTDLVGFSVLRTNRKSSSPVVARINRTRSAAGTKDSRLDDQGLDLDTTVIITSNLIPTHPSIYMINQTIESLKLLKGLSPLVPIFVPVDFPKQNISESDFHRRQEYVKRLRSTYGHRPNFHILDSPKHLHLAGSIKLALDRVTTKYIYVLQHDLVFTRTVDHTNLRKSMEEYPQYIRNVRFNYRPYNIWRPCTWFQQKLNLTHGATTPADNVNGIQTHLTNFWSDQNQLTTKLYYDEMLKEISVRMSRKHNISDSLSLERFMEGPMQNFANENCSYWGQSLLGVPAGPSGWIKHLDGRQTSGR